DRNVTGVQTCALPILAVPAAAAPAAARTAVEAGVRGILNFSPTVIDTPDTVRVHQVDLASELQVLAYYSALDTAPLNPGFEEHRSDERRVGNGGRARR